MAKVTISIPDELKKELDNVVEYPETRSSVAAEAIRLYLDIKNSDDPELTPADA